MARALAWMISLVLAGCTGAAPRKACDTVRPKCLTEMVCSYDVRQDCEVCRCAPPPYVPPQKP